MKKYVIVFVMFVFVAIVFCGCADNNTVEQDFEVSVEETEETETTIVTVDETETEESSDETVENVEGTVIAGELKFAGAEKYYSYVAPQTGIYRFDLDINNVNYDYRFQLLSPKDEELCNISYQGYKSGDSCQLEKGVEYRINIYQKENNPSYTIKIGVPEEVKTINGNQFSGKLDYEDKSNEYRYKAPVSGQYRFDFDINDVNCDYRFEIFGEKSESLASGGYGRSGGVTCELKKGTTYTIVVEQSNGLPNYKINIGVPKKIKTVENGVFKGNITYTDQVDRYKYTLKKGHYILKFSGLNADANVLVEMFSTKNENVLSARKSDEGVEFDIDKNDEYTIYVNQKEGFTEYKLSIE